MAETDTDGIGAAVAKVVSSTYRKRVLESMADDGQGTPTDVARREILGVASPEAHVSRALKSLKELDCVELLVPEDTRKGRLYRITDTGREVLAVVEGDGDE